MEQMQATMNNTPTNTNEPERLVSIRQAASRLGISTRAIYRLMARRELPPPVKVGGASRLYVSDLDTYLDGLKAKRAKVISRNT